MNKEIELLNLNEDAVRDLAVIYSEYGDLIIKSNEEDENRDNENQQVERIHLIANTFLIGGLFYSLFDAVEARKNFDRAANHFLNLNSFWWYVCVILAQWEKDKISRKMREFSARSDSFDPHTNFFRMLTLLQFESRNDIYNKIRFIKGEIPGTSVPYEIAIDIINQLEMRDIQEGRFDIIFKRFMDRIGDWYEDAQDEDIRWRYLEGPIVPYEPAILATLMVIIKLSKKQNSIFPILENIELPRKQKALIELADKLIR